MAMLNFRFLKRNEITSFSLIISQKKKTKIDFDSGKTDFLEMGRRAAPSKLNIFRALK